jgi:hypothetical protein
MTLCPQCRRDYPSHLFIEDLCPICALRNRNEMQGLRPDTPFRGENGCYMSPPLSSTAAVETLHGKQTSQLLRSYITNTEAA